MPLAVKDIWKVGLGFLEIGLAAVSHFLAGSLGLLTKQDQKLQCSGTNTNPAPLKLKWELSWTLSIGNKLWRKLFIPSNFDQRVSFAVKIDQL